MILQLRLWRRAQYRPSRPRMCLVGPGPVEHLTQSSERTGIENNWFALTGRIVAAKVEVDGDLHLALQDAAGDKAGIVVCEIPAKQQWCSIRETVFSWTPTRFPFHTSSAKKLTRTASPLCVLRSRTDVTVSQTLQNGALLPLNKSFAQP